MALQITTFNGCCPLYNIMLSVCVRAWVWMGRYPGERTMWEITQKEIFRASSPNLHLGKQSLFRSSRKHILNLLTVIVFVSLGHISKCELWNGPKRWYSPWTGLTPAVGKTLTSRVTALSSTTIHQQEDVYTPRYVGSKDIKFWSEKLFIIFSSNKAYNLREGTHPQYSGLILVQIINHIQNISSQHYLIKIPFWVKHLSTSAPSSRLLWADKAAPGLTRCFRLAAVWSRCLSLLLLPPLCSSS